MVGWLAEEERQGRRTVLERTGLAGLTVLRAGVPLSLIHISEPTRPY